MFTGRPRGGWEGDNVDIESMGIDEMRQYAKSFGMKLRRMNVYKTRAILHGETGSDKKLIDCNMELFERVGKRGGGKARARGLLRLARGIYEKHGIERGDDAILRDNNLTLADIGQGKNEKSNIFSNNEPKDSGASIENGNSISINTPKNIKSQIENGNIISNNGQNINIENSNMFSNNTIKDSKDSIENSNNISNGSAIENGNNNSNQIENSNNISINGQDEEIENGNNVSKDTPKNPSVIIENGNNVSNRGGRREGAGRKKLASDEGGRKHTHFYCTVREKNMLHILLGKIRCGEWNYSLADALAAIP